MSNWWCPRCGRQWTGRNGNEHVPGDKPLQCLVCERPKDEHTPEEKIECTKCVSIAKCN